MKMNLASYKKVHEDADTATFRHEKGHEIKVAKTALSPELKNQLKGIPVHMDEGGEALDIEPVTPPGGSVDFEPISQGQQVASSSLNPRGSIAPSVPQQNIQNGIEAKTPPASAMVVQPGAIPTAVNTDDYQKQYQTYNQGLLKQGEIAAQQEQIKAAAEQKHIENMQKLQSDYQNNMKQLNGHVDSFISDIQNQHFDSDQYLKNMSGGQKAATAIGLILGGIGGALTHQENPAMKFLQSQIDRNIDQQKADFGKKKTILEANYQKFGNMNDAIKMTQAMEGAILTAHLNRAAAQNGSLAAKNNAQMASSQFLTSTVYPNIQTIAMKQSLAQGAANGTVDPAQYVQYVVPKEHQAKVFEEIGRAQNVSSNSDKIDSMFNQAANENTILRTGAGMLRTPGSVMALHQLLLPNFKQVDGTVRQAAMDETFKNVTPAPGDSDAKIAYKRQALHNWMHSEMAAPTAKGFGVDLTHFASTTDSPVAKLNPQQQQYLQWAKANPNDPRAQAVFQKLGVK